MDLYRSDISITATSASAMLVLLPVQLQSTFYHVMMYAVESSTSTSIILFLNLTSQLPVQILDNPYQYHIMKYLVWTKIRTLESQTKILKLIRHWDRNWGCEILSHLSLHRAVQLVCSRESATLDVHGSQTADNVHKDSQLEEDMIFDEKSTWGCDCDFKLLWWV